MKGSGYFDLEDKTLIISCAGNLTVRGDVGSSIRFVTDGSEADQYDQATGRFNSNGNAALRVPHYISVIIEQVGGNLQVKSIDGSLNVDSRVGGNATLATVNGGVTLHDVGGNLTVKHAGGSLTVKGRVGGDFNAKHTGDITTVQIGGNANLKHISGDVALESVGGNFSARHMNGDISAETVEGDCALSHIGGAVNITSLDDIRLSGPLTSGKHTLTAGSRIDFYARGGEPLTVTAEAPTIVNNIQFDKVVEEAGRFVGSNGSDGAMLTLLAEDKITLRGKNSLSGDWGSFADFEVEFNESFDFSELNELGEQISAEVNARMEEISTRLTPEVNQYAERAIRKAKEAVDRVVERMESELARAEAQAERAAHRAERAAHREERAAHRSRQRPAPPKPPTPPIAPKQDTSAAQLKILKMLEDGKITIEQANELLAALE